MKNSMWGTGIVALLFTLVIASCAHYEPPQKEEACPLPTGVKPIDPPRVTAQQVEDGSGSLMDFALAVRDQLRGGTGSPEESVYISCLFREETSPWHSGDTYLVTLTQDGRIWEHTKDMSYAGRRLKPEIYGDILHTLGINPADLANRARRVAAFDAAATRNGGEFDLPHIPNASGYTLVIKNAHLTLVFIVGFDVDESHLVEEKVDIRPPTVTAAEVVDRETLKAFVTEAGERILAIFESGSSSELAKTKVAFRDSDGPWRHGSVYLYALDITSHIIVFHGAFPDRYENRPLVLTLVKDAVTGKLVLPQIIEAAKSNPEGGFVEYYFDDPADPNDNDDTPKVGYARLFSTMVGPGITVEFIIGSGFYLNTTDRN